jgi:hypothetical protein
VVNDRIGFIKIFLESLGQERVELKKNSSKYLLVLGLIVSFLLNQGCSKKNPTGPNGGVFGEVTAHALWSPRYGMGGAVFNNEMWVVGGAWGIAGSVTQYYGGVYNSSNGSQWTQTLGDNNGYFGNRYSPGVLSYGGKLWVIGGNQSGALKNDVWNSPDGTNWTQVATVAPIFTPREDFISIVYNGAMYIIGGWDNSPEADIWKSINGANWTLVNPALNTGAIPTYKLGFTPRWGSAATVFNGLIWILQGDGGNPFSSANLAGSSNGDEWTFDGATLTLVTLGPDIGNMPYPMLYHQITANNGLLWLTPGSAPGALTFDGYYTSADGLNWSWGNSYPPRCGHVALSYNSQDWVMGGYNNQCNTTPSCAITYYNDVWTTQ